MQQQEKTSQRTHRSTGFDPFDREPQYLANLIIEGAFSHMLLHKDAADFEYIDNCYLAWSQFTADAKTSKEAASQS